MGLAINSKFKNTKVRDMPSKEKDKVYTLLMCLGGIQKGDLDKTPTQLSNRIAFDFI